ncbi:bifunctional diaminohydroxyphosphoribosylaminopyrimidine deaminase/5-amino-6-(5-phosphoribosylamino)uracil reductase RibD [Pelagibacterales bacterium SAG-MED45]|nr:bifunctional diaminohydroxyphosphoribosylaminopyrimidine deaminase/5-amino-6-(5-phosphoribosylamino)uracil reductase RibD [Pelagibacterales bacterium SAG-MED45]
MSQKKVSFSKKDKSYMHIALKLAKAREGLTGTNPSVGCVIVKNDHIISIGQTSSNGRPHAEANAIKHANESLVGSKMYVTLEPCNHYGLTSPCTKKIINSKISEVIYSIEDVDKRVKNKSFKILKSKEITVKTGLLKKETKKFYMPYFFNRKKEMPYVTGKIAISKNHLIYSKNQNKITNIHSDKFTHFLRYKNDSIIISSKTLNTDNPRLNCRLKGLEKYSPIRIVLDKNLNSKINNYIFKTADKKNTLIFYNKASKSKIVSLTKYTKLIKSRINKKKALDIKLIMKKLYKLGLRNVLVEGGNELTLGFFKERLFNQFYLFKSKKKLSTNSDYIKFNCLNLLNKRSKSKTKLKSYFGNDTITHYKF